VKENIFKRGSQIFKFIVNGWGVFFRGVSGVELSISVTRCRRSSSTPLTPVFGPLLRALLSSHLH
jgi:hypothetical protein